jgi:hypothetical protein
MNSWGLPTEHDAISHRPADDSHVDVDASFQGGGRGELYPRAEHIKNDRKPAE